MWDLIWRIVSAVIFKVAVRLCADAGELGLIGLARRSVIAQVRTLPATLGEAILADFEARRTTADKLRFAIQLFSAHLKLRVMHGTTKLLATVRSARWPAHYPPGQLYASPMGNYLLLPICKLMRRHTWKHRCNPALYYCRVCGTPAPRWSGVHNGHGGYHCDLTVRP